jgi:hypothetical protein
MLELRCLPDHVDVVVGDLALDRQKVEEDVRLLDHFDVKIRTEDVVYDPVVEDPGGQLEPDILDLVTTLKNFFLSSSPLTLGQSKQTCLSMSSLVGVGEHSKYRAVTYPYAVSHSMGKFLGWYSQQLQPTYYDHQMDTGYN